MGNDINAYDRKIDTYIVARPYNRIPCSPEKDWPVATPYSMGESHGQGTE